VPYTNFTAICFCDFFSSFHTGETTLEKTNKGEIGTITRTTFTEMF